MRPAPQGSRGPPERLCASGSADGSLRLFNLLECKRADACAAAAAACTDIPMGLVAELYGATWGHNDWVTCCAFAAGDCLLSGGMDGRVCLWPDVSSPSTYTERDIDSFWGPQTPYEEQLEHEQLLQQQLQQLTTRATRGPRRGPPRPEGGTRKRRIRSTEILPGHRAGVSDLKVRGPWGAPPGSAGAPGGPGCPEGPNEDPLAASVGYDGSLRLWNVKGRRQIAELPAVDLAAGGSLCELSPLLQFVWLNAFAAAGSRSGSVYVWDLNAAKVAATVTAAHNGAVGDLQLLLPPPEAAAAAAPSVTDISSSSSSSGFVPLLLSGGRGDGRLCVFDLRCLPSAVCTAWAHPAALNAVLPLRRGGGPLPCSAVATLGADGCCKLWDLRCTDTPTANVHASTRGFLCGAVIDEQMGFLCAGAAEGAVYMLDMGLGGGAPAAATLGGPPAAATHGGPPAAATLGGPPAAATLGGAPAAATRRGPALIHTFGGFLAATMGGGPPRPKLQQQQQQQQLQLQQQQQQQQQKEKKQQQRQQHRDRTEAAADAWVPLQLPEVTTQQHNP
ncbi:WD domain, G-beta repeat-containing protein, putative [Eimeria mitis]|uniref:WD domain, G-beta repeat-containing protein, putative n=1 Tax=Eimeria mitis TaxID=44415 RepID=U6K2P6_9EIME|nr:WD domain, G-beta repeat-containing protein, putative [Eimeria mitis]CDJ31995.1 WD domain, G-beta repeat-containing protein, putative [Eimeria mitis]